jgi:prepilin peptidase CpaA
VTSVAGAAFGILLGMACLMDIRERRIPNAVVVLLLVSGLGVAALRTPGWPALAGSLGGVATGLALWLPFWLMQMIGAGDVKLFAAASAWLGPRLAVEGALWAGLFGGVVAMVFMLRGQGIGFTILRLGHAVRQPLILRDTSGAESSRRLPYGLALAAGAATAAWFPGVLL